MDERCRDGAQNPLLLSWYVVAMMISSEMTKLCTVDGQGLAKSWRCPLVKWNKMRETEEETHDIRI